MKFIEMRRTLKRNATSSCRKKKKVARAAYCDRMKAVLFRLNSFASLLREKMT